MSDNPEDAALLERVAVMLEGHAEHERRFTRWDAAREYSDKAESLRAVSALISELRSEVERQARRIAELEAVLRAAPSPARQWVVERGYISWYDGERARALEDRHE